MGGRDQSQVKIKFKKFKKSKSVPKDVPKSQNDDRDHAAPGQLSPFASRLDCNPNRIVTQAFAWSYPEGLHNVRSCTGGLGLGNTPAL